MYASPPSAPGPRTRSWSRTGTTAALVSISFALACVLAAGCSTEKILGSPNTPPTVSLTSGSVDTLSNAPDWTVEVAWTAHDPDGRIAYFEYALDPPTLKQASLAQAETSWVQTGETRATVRFRRSPTGSTRSSATSPEYHLFVLRAVDDRGGMSPLLARAFFANTAAPDVQITRPVPSALLRPTLPLPFRVEWSTTDPDGDPPAFHRLRLLSLEDPANLVYLAYPESLLHHGAETGWVDWLVASGDATSFSITEDHLSPTQSAVLAVVAVDAAGAYTPYLDLSRNFLQFTASTFSETLGPRIHLYTQFLDFTYPTGGWSVDPSREVPMASSGLPIEIHWDGVPMPGSQLTESRWMLDGDPYDETPRSDPGDVAHWSEPGPAASSASVGPLAAGTHRFYVELRDDFGARSLGIVRLEVSTPGFERELLVVDDTRLEVDKFNNDVFQRRRPDNYTQAWPSATELDTFLYARGGVPWRGTQNPPEGVLSSPGLLAGYSFDTLGTRRVIEDPTQVVPLSKLTRYRHVLWIVDDRSATYNHSDIQHIRPITVLRAMSRPGHTNTLSTYIVLGGRVWLAGGGAAFASLIEFDRPANNVVGTTFFSVSQQELAPGRPLYDAAHVRSTLGVTRTTATPERSAAAIGGWSGHGPDGTLSAPDYSRLPAQLRYRTADLDPLPPTRLSSQSHLYYRTDGMNEFISKPNIILEDFDPDPSVERFESALDTLLEATGPQLPLERAPCMLYYHGRENVPFVFSGFEPWNWTREDCQALVDFVLGDIWGLVKAAPGAGTTNATAMGTARAGGRSAAPLRREAQRRERRP